MTPGGPDLDLHADAEDWESNRDGRECEACGGPRVVFIPVWADGGGILTPDEIEEVVGRARMRVLEEWEKTESRGLEPMMVQLPDDIVLRIDGRRDGSFRAVILASGGAHGQAYTRYGRGSSLLGAVGWRHGLTISRYTRLDTTEEEAAEGLAAFEGAPGILNFTRRERYEREGEARETYRLERSLRDRTSRTTSWSRHERAGPRPPQAEGEGPGEAAEGQAAE